MTKINIPDAILETENPELIDAYVQSVAETIAKLQTNNPEIDALFVKREEGETDD